MSWKTFKSLVVGVGIILLTSILMTACGGDIDKDHVRLYDTSKPLSQAGVVGRIKIGIGIQVTKTPQSKQTDGEVNWVVIKVDSPSGFWIKEKFLDCPNQGNSCTIVKPKSQE